MALPCLANASEINCMWVKLNIIEQNKHISECEKVSKFACYHLNIFNLGTERLRERILYRYVAVAVPVQFGQLL